MTMRTFLGVATAIALSSTAWAAQPSTVNQPRGVPTPAPATAPGARGGYGPGQRGGWGPGMMGWGGGMMGGYGPGMMGGYGPGMMGGYGPGVMGGWGWGGNLPDLTAEQRNKISAIQRDLRNKQFALMDAMHDQWASADTYRGGKFDEQAARKAYDQSQKLHRQMFENMLDAQKRIDAVLTPQQRQELEQGSRR